MIEEQVLFDASGIGKLANLAIINIKVPSTEYKDNRQLFMMEERKYCSMLPELEN
jgi:hypothetical protein